MLVHSGTPLRKLKAAVEAHADEIVAAVRKDLIRKAFDEREVAPFEGGVDVAEAVPAFKRLFD